MKKAIILFVLLSLYALSYVSADTGTISFKYKIYKYVADVVNLGFTNIDNEDSISTYPIDVLKDLSEPQVRLRVDTNMIRSYNISLTFSPMHFADGSSPNLYWKYKAKIGNTSIVLDDVVFTSGDSVTRVFPGDYGNDGKVFICTYYPISFDFSDYISTYDTGSFSATIIVEVIS